MAESRFLTLSDIRLHYLDEGEGEVVVLLHGWPQTSHVWRHIIPKLSSKYRVLAPDLRGLGDSSRPTDGFDSGTVAGDIIALLDALAVRDFSIVGHDWGGPAAFAAASLIRDRVQRLALIDTVLPGDGRLAGSSQAGARWHHLFHRTSDLPEALTAGREATYLGWFFDEYSERGGAVGHDALAEYVRCYSQAGAMRCGFEYYRTLEISDAFIRSQLEWYGKLSIPVLSVAGGSGRGRGGEAEESIGQLVTNLRAHVIAGCGHLVPEEAPAELSALLLHFLAGSG